MGKTFYWVFEGNEGTGKSTLSKKFAERCNAVWTYEPNGETEELKFSWNPLDGFGSYETRVEELEGGDSVDRVPAGKHPYALRLHVRWKAPLSEECCELRDRQSEGTEIYAEYWLDEHQKAPTQSEYRLPMAGRIPNGGNRGGPALGGGNPSVAQDHHNLPTQQAGELRVKVTASGEVCYDEIFRIQ
jgi:hypothetical protein